MTTHLRRKVIRFILLLIECAALFYVIVLLIRLLAQRFT